MGNWLRPLKYLFRHLRIQRKVRLRQIIIDFGCLRFSSIYLCLGSLQHLIEIEAFFTWDVRKVRIISETILLFRIAKSLCAECVALLSIELLWKIKLVRLVKTQKLLPALSLLPFVSGVGFVNLISVTSNIVYITLFSAANCWLRIVVMHLAFMVSSILGIFSPVSMA